MALVTGGVDNLGCFLKYIGLDASEYSAPGAGGRLDIYQGLPAGASFGGTTIGGSPGLSTGTAGDCTSDNPACVWHTKANFEKYDIVLLACEGATYDADDPDNKETTTNKTTTAKQALYDWLNEGGKVFATHFHYTWFKNSPQPDFQNVATWLGSSGAGNTTKGYDIDTTFPKGVTFNSWLGNPKVSALTGTQIDLTGVAQSVSTVNATAQRWIYDPSDKNAVKYLSFVTPIGGIKTVDAGESNAQYCGKAVFTDLHAGGTPTGNVPGSCTATTLSAQLKALEFLFFDLSACVSDDKMSPPGPPQPTK
jgi:hypothetical protein